MHNNKNNKHLRYLILFSGLIAFCILCQGCSENYFGSNSIRATKNNLKSYWKKETPQANIWGDEVAAYVNKQTSDFKNARNISKYKENQRQTKKSFVKELKDYASNQ
jgi:hypothetical protein